MVAREVLASLGLLVLGLVLLAVGWIIEPARPAVDATGESLIALGLTFTLFAIGYFLAWANPTS